MIGDQTYEDEGKLYDVIVQSILVHYSFLIVDFDFEEKRAADAKLRKYRTAVQPTEGSYNPLL
jgi:hypothetical protein